MFQRCPKCGHQPLPADQSLPAACPGCGAILAKLRALELDEDPLPPRAREAVQVLEEPRAALLWNAPEGSDALAIAGRAALWAAFAWWSVVLARLDVRTGEMGSSFLHGPLLVFHEAGHVVFMPFGEWLTIAGGSLGQLLMPAILAGALLWTNRDPFGASFGLWLVGASLVDLSPYVYDAWDPQLVLLGGHTGQDGPHDWMFLLDTLHARHRSQGIGLAVHHLGVLVMLLALAWGAALLVLQWRQRDGAR